MNRTCAAMLLLCAVCVMPNPAGALTHPSVPEPRAQRVFEPADPDRLPVVDDAAPPLRLFASLPPAFSWESSAPPGPFRAPEQADLDSPVAGLFTPQELLAQGTWIDPRLLQALSPQDRVAKIRKWYAQRPTGKAKPQAAAKGLAKR
jgi:hypothetical protein